MIPRLAYVTDGKRGTGGRPLLDVARAAVQGGVDMIVFRELSGSDAEICRTLEALLPLCEHNVKLLVSRRVDLARALGLDGVHLAADAIPVAEARAWLGPRALIGYSAHSGQEARAAGAEGADYVTLSPIFATRSKPDQPGRGLPWLADAASDARIPTLALGGVTPARTRELLSAGAWGVAAVEAIGAAPDVRKAAQQFNQALVEDIS